MRTIIFGLLALAFATTSAAGEPQAFAWGAYNLQCNNEDQIVALPNRDGRFIQGVIGASPLGGPMPPRPFKITKVEIIHWTSDPKAFAVVGKTGQGGDYISPYIVGSTKDRFDFAADERPTFNDGDEMHIHAGCNSNSGQHSIAVTIRIITIP